MLDAIHRALADPSSLMRRALGVPSLERGTLIAIVAVAGLLLLFGIVAEAVVVGGTRTFDEALLLALREPANTVDPIGPVWVEEAMRDLSAMGSTTVLTFVTLGPRRLSRLHPARPCGDHGLWRSP